MDADERERGKAKGQEHACPIIIDSRMAPGLPTTKANAIAYDLRGSEDASILVSCWSSAGESISAHDFGRAS